MPIDLLKNDPAPPWKPGPHTPGPWSEFAESGDYWIAQVADDGMPGAMVCDSVGISEGDTILICAAPDLLAALETFCAKYSSGAPVERVWEHDISLLRAAVRKARGE